MKKFIFILGSLGILFSSSALADSVKGKQIFETKGCSLCHKIDFDTIGPSLQTIAISYLGKEQSLLLYLKGQAKPIVDPARAPVMNPQLVKIRTLFEDDTRSLAEYIVSSNDRPL